MKEHGKVIFIAPTRTGVSQKTNQPWATLEFVIQMDGRYLRHVKFTLNGIDNINKANLRVGDIIDVYAEVSAHEYNGTWYNDVQVYDIEREGHSLLRAPIMTTEQSLANLQQQQQQAQNQQMQMGTQQQMGAQQQIPQGAPQGQMVNYQQLMNQMQQPQQGGNPNGQLPWN